MIEALNNRLKVGLVGVTIEQRGERLYLVATLPPKPESGKKVPYQQRISLGIKANPAGLKCAELEAKKLGIQIAEGSFSWNKPQEKVTVADAIALFETKYFEDRGSSPKIETTYKSNYAQLFRKLPKEEVLTQELLIKTIELTKPHTRTRQLICRAFCLLGKQFDIDLNISRLKGNYSAKSVNPKNLPTDKEIQDYVNNFSYAPYKWIYGMMATFGLRNHEVFFVDHETLIKENICHVLAGKRGEGKVWPLYPEWIEYFDLKNIRLPKIKGDTNKDYGERVGRGFSRSNIPFSPYALRHSWARRAIEMGLDSQLAAKQMRHSHTVHVTIYAAWLDDSVHQRAFDKILDDPNRLRPPNREEIFKTPEISSF